MRPGSHKVGSSQNLIGSIPTKLFQLTVQQYYKPDRIPDRIRMLLKCSFNRLKIRSIFRTSQHRGSALSIFTGCTVSVILFSAAVNLNGEVGGENEQRSIKESRREKTPCHSVHGRSVGTLKDDSLFLEAQRQRFLQHE